MEQIREGFLGFWRNRAARLIVAVLLGGFVVLRLLTPEIVPFDELKTGDCVYIRPPGPAELTTSVQPVPATTAELVTYSAAERADCGLSHSHEVSDAFSVGGSGTYPGIEGLISANGERCEAAFEPFVGREPDGSAYGTVLAIPGITAWQGGARYGVCFVFHRDQTLLDHRAAGSGE